MVLKIDQDGLLGNPLTFAAAASPQGRTWIDGLPRMIATALRRWWLEVDGDVRSGSNAIVIPVRRGDEPCVLKAQGAGPFWKSKP